MSHVFCKSHYFKVDDYSGKMHKHLFSTPDWMDGGLSIQILISPLLY